MDDEKKLLEIQAARHALYLELSDAHGKALVVSQAIGRGPGGREIALVLTKIEEALLWSGMIETPFAR